MHRIALTAPEQRVLGCLIEKRYTTPDQYPLTLNALRLAANQSTNRAPVTDYDEDTVHRAAQRLCQYGLARLASGHSSRAIKYRHLAEEALGLQREELALLAVLLLRGPQTPGELKARSERLAQFSGLEELEDALGRLRARGYVRRLARQPGQKEERWLQLLGQAGDEGLGEAGLQPPAGAAVGHEAGACAGAQAPGPEGADQLVALQDRVAALESEVAQLRETVSRLDSAVAALREGALR